MPIAVKWFSSDMRGAPTISGTAGSRIAALDACLITGFGPVTPTGITVSGGIATATLPSGQSFAQHAVVLVSGATPTALNGEARVLTTSSTQITFATTAADGAASGTIEIRYAPVGSWDKVFTGTHKAVYRGADVTGPRHYLRVDDTGTAFARVRGFESMTDVDTGTGPFPTDAQMNGGGYWHKSTSGTAAGVRWRLLADEKMILLAIAPGSHNGTSLVAPLRGFGAPIGLRPAGDSWATLLCAGGAGTSAQGGALDGSGGASGSTGFIAAPRVWQGLGSSVFLNPLPTTGSGGTSGANNTWGVFPSEVDGELKLARVLAFESGTNKPPRVRIPGVFHIPQSGVLSLISDGDTVPGSADLAGRMLLMVGAGTNMGVATAGIYAVDTTGPWR